MVVLIRYAEPAIKRGRTREEMEALLVRSIREAALKCGRLKFRLEPGRIYVYSDDDICTARAASRVFGVRSASPAYELDFSDLDDLANKIAEIWRGQVVGRTFAVRPHRVGVHNFTSRDVAARIGELLVKSGGKVDLEDPQVEVFVEVRENKAYTYRDLYEGPGGLPLGSEGKVLALVSGGIDSPVAAWYIMRRGAYADVFYCNLGGSLTEAAALRVIDRLLEWSYGYDAKVLVADCAPIADSIRRFVDHHLWSIAFKRALYRLAERAARLVRAEALVTGESLGQVSSQTLQALAAVELGVDMPVFRPLIGLDKEEIVKMAQKIGTYELSVSVPEYCGIFSKEPRRWASRQEVEYIDLYVYDAVEEAYRSIKTIKKSELKSALMQVGRTAEGLVIHEVPEGAVLVDLRDQKDYAKWHLPGAIRIDLDRVFDFVEREGRDKTYVFYCYEGALSADVAERLRKSGYKAYSLGLTIH
ncbi:MAG: tRNA uracil 4-sulfurtransferase ThiI [Thermoproteus sp.]